MQNVKKMILGIALLILALVGAIFWTAGSIIGAIAFFLFLVIGGYLIIDGYLSVDED